MSRNFSPVLLHHEGVDLVGQIVRPASAPRASLLVMPSAMGLGAHYLRIGERLAEAGYVALVADLYGGGAAFSRREDAGTVHGPLSSNPALVRSRAVAWFEALRNQADSDPRRLAALGYCFGGLCVLELARSGAEVAAVFSYHGTLTTGRPAQPGAIKGLVSIYTGGKDPLAPRSDIDAFVAEMEGAGASYTLSVFSDAQHAFTTVEDGSIPMPGLAYDPLADALSWAGTLATLEHILA